MELLSFNKLSEKDRLFLSHAGVDSFIKICSDRLKNRLGDFNLYKIDQPYLNEVQSKTLTSYIIEILKLIGKSNSFILKPKKTLDIEDYKLVDSFFKGSDNLDSFKVNFSLAIYHEKENTLIAQDERADSDKNTLIIGRNKDPKDDEGVRLHTEAFSDEHFKGTNHHIKYTKYNLPKTELEAVAALYLLGIVWSKVKEELKLIEKENLYSEEIVSVLRWFSQVYMFFEAPGRDTSRSTGGAKSKKNSKFEGAYKIIEDEVRKAPMESTQKLKNRIVKKAKSSLTPDEIPQKKTIEDKIRATKKKFTNKY